MARSLGVSLRKMLKRAKPNRKQEVVSVPDVRGVGARPQRIPAVVFHTAESRDVHPTHLKSILEVRKQNPDLDFLLFDATQRDEYMSTQWAHHPIYSVYLRGTTGQMRADLFRYCIVWDRGGYYFDLNKGISTQLTGLHSPEASGVVTYENNAAIQFPMLPLPAYLDNPFNLIAQWGFGFEARHKFLGLLIERIVEAAPLFAGREFKNPKNAIVTLTGPGMFTRVFREYLVDSGDSTIEQLGEDFLGEGIFRLRGSKFLWEKGSHYSEQANLPILRPE